MRTGFKVLIGVAAVVAVLIAGAAIAILTVDPNTLIAPVKAQVAAATGRELTVRGGARIALSLHPRLVLNDVALSNAPWGVAKQMLQAERLEVAVALLPLLLRRYEIEEIALVKPQIALETDGKAQRNWEPPPSPGGAKASNPGVSAALAIGQIEVSDGVLTYQDGPTAVISRVGIERLMLKPKAMSSNVAVEFRGTVADTAVSLAGTMGTLESLLARQWPYPIDLAGEIAGQKTALAVKIKAEGKRYTLDDLKLAFGANALTGTFAVDTEGARPKVVFDLSAPVLALRGLPLPPAAPAAGAPKPARAYLFPDVAVSFAPLRWVDAQGKLAIGKLTLASGEPIDNLRMQFTLADARLDMPDFSLARFGGTIGGSLSIDASQPGNAAVALRIDGRGLSLGAILTAAGLPREVKGGKADLSANLAMRGNSPHAWASTATGNVRLVSGPATLLNNKLETIAAWDRITEAINPFRARDPSTELQCAVVRLPLANGVAKVDRSIAMETNKLGVSASGTLDFRNETLDFTFQPKVKKGISIDFAGFSDMVQVRGPFASPQLQMSVVGSAKVIASIGAAVSTGGLSAVGQALLSWADGSGPGPCQIALGGPAAASTAKATGRADPAIPIASDLGKAIGKLFGK